MSEVLEQILDAAELPSLPKVAARIVALCQRPGTRSEDIAHAVRYDPALAMKILRAVNRQRGSGDKITRLTLAVEVLGAEKIKTLALGFSLVSGIRDRCGDAFDIESFWQRCVYGALAARTVAATVKLPLEEEAYLLGLLADIGMLAMAHTLGSTYLQVVKTAGHNPRILDKLERSQFKIDHAEAGAALAKRWSLPALIERGIRFHVNPDAAPRALRPLARTVAAGGLAADALLSQEHSTAAVEAYFASLHEWFAMRENEAKAVLRNTITRGNDIAQRFNIKLARQLDVETILQDANDTLVQMNLQSQAARERLMRRNQELQDQLGKDPMTGLLNRMRFEQVARSAFETCVKHGFDLSAVFLDIDCFKAINDTHGHMIGDRVILAVVDLITAQAPRQAHIGRFGGEEFVILLPRVDRKQAGNVADEIRQAVAEAVIPIDDDLTISLTISGGVAGSLGDAKLEGTLDSLLHVADNALYAAKRAGRDCIRVYTGQLTKA